jgi:hypothetical protein
MDIASSSKTYSKYVIYDNLENLTTKSNVPVCCPKCGSIKIVKLCSHLQTIRKNRGKYLCHSCSIDPNKCSENAKKLWADQEKSGRIRNHLCSKRMKEIVSAKNKKLFSNKEWVLEWKNKINKELISANSKKMWENPEFRKRISRSFSKRCKEQWQNFDYRNKMMAYFESTQRKLLMVDIRKKMAQSKSSKQQDTLYKLLDDLNVIYEKEACFGYYLFDCMIKPQPGLLLKNTLLIEVNGDYWYSLPKSVRNDKSKATYIQRYFPKHEIKYLWEHEFVAMDRVRNLLKYWLGLAETEVKQFDFHNVTERVIDNRIAEIFISQYHYAGRLGKSGVNLGYFLGDKLIAVIVYSHAVRQEVAVKQGMKYNQVRELSRLAIRPSYQMKNFASYIISRSINHIKNNHAEVKLLVSFSDSTYNHSGTIYKASNWIFDGIVHPDYWYVDNDGYVCHKKTLWNKAKEMKMTESEYSSKYGYRQVWGGEKHRYVFKLCV